METTVKVFDNDVYATTLTARVLACNEKEVNHKKIYQIILDKTIFFPEGGGQSPDLGMIDGKAVMDVQIENDIITHTLYESIEVGSEVSLEIDWNHRFCHMQQHSGEHIFSGLVHAKYGYHNVGFHLSDQICTMDFSGPLTEAQVTQIEYEVNECIAKNIPIEILYPSKEELASMNYRSKIEIEGQVRIIRIPGYDMCACCGTHVKNSGEIGIFKVINTQNYKGGIRITLVCGLKALEDYRKKQERVVKISNILSVQQDAIVDAVAKLKHDFTSIKQELNMVKEKMMLQKVAQIEQSLENVCLFERDLETDVMRAAVNALTEKHVGYCAVFSGNDEIGYRYIIGCKDGDAREMGNILRETFHAKGGGKPAMIQGSLQGKQEDIKKLF